MTQLKGGLMRRSKAQSEIEGQQIFSSIDTFPGTHQKQSRTPPLSDIRCHSEGYSPVPKRSFLFTKVWQMLEELQNHKSGLGPGGGWKATRCEQAWKDHIGSQQGIDQQQYYDFQLGSVPVQVCLRPGSAVCGTKDGASLLNYAAWCESGIGASTER